MMSDRKASTTLAVRYTAGPVLSTPLLSELNCQMKKKNLNVSRGVIIHKTAICVSTLCIYRKNFYNIAIRKITVNARERNISADL